MAVQHDPPQGTALAHLKILDLSRILAGPWATQTLGDLGATIIKIENPGKGDDTRHWGPPFVDAADGTRSDAAYFTACNRNKLSVGIDFRATEGADLVRRLADNCDIVVENFKLGGLKKYGLDYASLSSRNPSLIYCSITGFGQTGPYAHRAGYDFLVQGMGGLMSITGQPDTSAGAEPMKVGVAIADLFTGMYATTSILGAVVFRDRTGKGQYIDCALLDSQVAMLANQATNWMGGDFVPTRMGNNHPNIVPYRVFPTKDGYVIIACGNDTQFEKLCQALSLDALGDDDRFSTNAGRVANRQLVDDAISAATSSRNRDEVIKICEQHGVPCGPINNIDDVFNDEQVQARGMEIKLRRKDSSTLKGVAYPARLSESPASYRSAPPVLGQHTDLVLQQELGLTTAQLSTLRDKSIID